MQGVVQEQQEQQQYQPGTVTVLWLCIFFGIMCCVIAESPHQVVSFSGLWVICR